MPDDAKTTKRKGLRETLLAQPGMREEIERLLAMSTDDLVAEHERLWGKKARVRHRDYLWKRCARKLQEIRTGGLSKKAAERLEEVIALIRPGIEELLQGAGKKGLSSPLKLALNRPAPKALRPGTSLVRDYKGRRLVVLVEDGGFSFEGRLYKSLSAIAKEVSGSHCSGRAFFGLTGRRSAT